ncbi:MAG: hypothetical protein WAT39_12500 [Planctomycetota bacterium]
MKCYLWLLCLVMPLVCVWIGGALFFIASDRAHVIPQLTGVWTFNSALVAAPFALLAMRAAARAKQPAIPGFRRYCIGASGAGMLATFLVWGVFYYEGYTYWAERKTSGANIGLGCFMVFSPILVWLAMFAGGAAFGARREGDERQATHPSGGDHPPSP